MTNALRSYKLLVRWNWLQIRPVLPGLIIAQVLLGGLGTRGMAFLIPHIDRTSALYLTTGGTTVSLLTLGLVVAPHVVVESRTSGLYDYFQSLPTPRAMHILAEITVISTMAVPGGVGAFFIALVRFHSDFSIQPTLTLVPAVILTVLATTSLGYAVALILKAPAAVNLVSSFLLISTLFFSPVLYPKDRLPGWLAGVHTVLPFEYMAQVIRNSLTGTAAGGHAFIALALWAVFAFGVTLRLAVRRS